MFRYPLSWTRVTGLTLLLLPLSLLFRLFVAIRRGLYQTGVLRSVRVSVPVIVVGNISVGGTGKTPLVLWLVARLREAGYRPGIISRGYGGNSEYPRATQADSDATVCGDEPVLMARHSGCAVWVGKDRAATASALLTANPDCNIIVSDDGLQHYRLARDFEIAVVDGERGHGNGWMLPAGPLREPASRLGTVDAVVVRGTAAPLSLASQPCLTMTLQPAGLRNLLDNRHLPVITLQGQSVHAVAGIGNPQQFFDTLTQLGITHAPHPFADHHFFSAADLQFDECDAVVMTEKDAVKCERYATVKHWALQIEARIDDALVQQLLDRIKRKR